MPQRISTEDAAVDPVVVDPGSTIPLPDTSGGPEVMVKYVGIGTRRILTEQDWADVGAKGQGGAEWNFANSFKIPASQFSPQALGYLKIDDNFEILS